MDIIFYRIPKKILYIQIQMHQKLTNRILKVTILLIFALLSQILGHPLSPQALQVQSLQTQITEASGMNYNKYKLYAFALVKRQQFVLQYQGEEDVKGEIRVNWIDSLGGLVFPTYDQHEFVKVEVFDVTNSRSVLVQHRKFYFQTGIHFRSEPMHTYKLVFTSQGPQKKVIQLAVSTPPPTLTQLSSQSSSNCSTQIQAMGHKLQQQLSYLSNKQLSSQKQVQKIYQLISSNLQRVYAYAVWELVLLGIVVLVQGWFFARALNRGLSHIV